MNRFLYLCLVLVSILGWTACGSPSSKAESMDPCTPIAAALQGVYKSPNIDGTMTWTGGITGSVEMFGKDYNDMVCTYSVNDCGNGIIKMDCDGATHNSTIELLPNSQIKLGQTIYDRVVQ